MRSLSLLALMALTLSVFIPAGLGQSVLVPCETGDDPPQPGHGPSEDLCFPDSFIGDFCDADESGTLCEPPPAPGTPGIVLNMTNATFTLTEAAGANRSTQFNVTLNAAPAAGSVVVLNLTNTVFGNTSQGQLPPRLAVVNGTSGSSPVLRFSSSNWDQPQPVNVTANDNGAVDGDVTTNVTLMADPVNTTDPAYDVVNATQAFGVVDNDVPPTTVTVSATDNVANETGGDTGAIKVSRAGPTTSALTVNFLVGGDANPGSDYNLTVGGTERVLTNKQGTLTIPAGATNVTVVVNAVLDGVSESAENLIFVLTAGSYDVGSPSSATVFILDGQAAPPPPLPVFTASAIDTTANETSPDNGAFLLTRNNSTQTMQVNFVLSGSATPVTDYRLSYLNNNITISGSLASITIPVGALTAEIALVAVDDAIIEGDQSATLTLASGSGYSVGTPAAAAITIKDNDVGPTQPVDPADSDGDGLSNEGEALIGTDPNKADTDGDGFNDGIEVTARTDPLDANSPDQRVGAVTVAIQGTSLKVSWSSAGQTVSRFLVWRAPTANSTSVVRVGAVERSSDVSDYSVLDSAYPGPPQVYFVQVVLGVQDNTTFDRARSTASASVTFPACDVRPTDTDGDGLCDAQERQLGTNPALKDSDFDGFSDAAEVEAGSDPLDADSKPLSESKSILEDYPVVVGTVLLVGIVVVALVAIVRFAKA